MRNSSMCRCCWAASSRLTGNRSPAEASPASRTSRNTSGSRRRASRAPRDHELPAESVLPGQHLAIMRGAIAAQTRACFERYVDEIYRHMWSEPKKMDDPAVIAGGARSPASMPSASRAGQDAEVKDAADRQHRSGRSRAARSARPPSSSATRSSSARTGCATSRKRLSWQRHSARRGKRATLPD